MEKFLEALDEVKESFGSKIEEVYRNLALKKLLLEEIKKKTQVISVKRIVSVPYNIIWDTKYREELETVTILVWKNFEDKVISIEHNLNSQKMERLAQVWIIEISYTTKNGEKVLEKKGYEKPLVRVKFFPPSLALEGHCIMQTFGDRKIDKEKKLIQELFGEVLVIQEEEAESAEIEKIKKKEDIEELEGEEKFPWFLQFLGDDRKIFRYKIL